MRIKLLIWVLLFGTAVRAVNVDLVIPDTGRHVEVNLDDTADFVETFQEQIDHLHPGDEYRIAATHAGGRYLWYGYDYLRQALIRQKTFLDPMTRRDDAAQINIDAIYVYRRNPDGSFAVDRDASQQFLNDLTHAQPPTGRDFTRVGGWIDTTGFNEVDGVAYYNFLNNCFNLWITPSNEWISLQNHLQTLRQEAEQLRVNPAYVVSLPPLFDEPLTEELDAPWRALQEIRRALQAGDSREPVLALPPEPLPSHDLIREWERLNAIRDERQARGLPIVGDFPPQPPAPFDYYHAQTEREWLTDDVIEQIKQAYRHAFAWIDLADFAPAPEPHVGPVPGADPEPARIPAEAAPLRIQLPVPAGQAPRHLDLQDQEAISTETFANLIDSARPNSIQIIEAQRLENFYDYLLPESIQGMLDALNPWDDVRVLSPITRQQYLNYIVYRITHNPDGSYTVARLANARLEGRQFVVDDHVVTTTHQVAQPIPAEPVHRVEPAGPEHGAEPVGDVHPEPDVPVAPAVGEHRALAPAMDGVVGIPLDGFGWAILSKFFATTRRTAPEIGLLWLEAAISSKAHLGFYAGPYAFDSRLVLIDYEPTMLPDALKLLLRDKGFDVERNAASIEFDAQVWRLEEFSTTYPPEVPGHAAPPPVITNILNAPHNIVLHGLINRWRGNTPVAQHFAPDISAGITRLNGITTTHTDDSIPEQLFDQNHNVNFHGAFSPNNGRWQFEPGRTVGSFWLVAFYDPVHDLQLTPVQRARLQRKALVSFITVLRYNDRNRALIDNLEAELLPLGTIVEVRQSLINFEDNIRAESVVDANALHEAIDIIADPEHAAVAIPIPFTYVPPLPAHPAWGAGEGEWRPFFARETPAHRDLFIAFSPVSRRGQLRAWAAPVVVPPPAPVPTTSPAPVVVPPAPGSHVPPAPVVVPPPAPAPTTSPGTGTPPPAPGSHVPPGPTTPPGPGTPPTMVPVAPPPPHIPAPRVFTQTEKLRRQISALQVQATVINKQIKQLNAQIAKTQKQLTQATKARNKKKINAFKNTLAQLKKSLMKMQKNLAQVKKQSHNAQVKLKQLGVDAKINAQKLVVKKRKAEVAVAKAAVSAATSAKKKLDAQLKGKKLVVAQKDAQKAANKRLNNAKKVLAGKEKQLRAAQVAQRKLEQEKKRIK